MANGHQLQVIIPSFVAEIRLDLSSAVVPLGSSSIGKEGNAKTLTSAKIKTKSAEDGG